MKAINEELLQEANRQQLLAKSRQGKQYSPKNRSKGKNRFERRKQTKISATVRDYNKIDMDGFFKRDRLYFKIPVLGENHGTYQNSYEVELEIMGVLKEVQRNVLANKGKLEFKIITQSLMRVFNVGEINIGCNCPDGKYRQAYNQTKNGYKAGYKEIRASNITNPNDDLGAGCKHILMVLANLEWVIKISSIISNYIKYCRQNLQYSYATYIFPKIYGVTYQNAVRQGLFLSGLLDKDQEVIQKNLFDKGVLDYDETTMSDVIRLATKRRGNRDNVAFQKAMQGQDNIYQDKSVQGSTPQFTQQSLFGDDGEVKPEFTFNKKEPEVKKPLTRQMTIDDYDDEGNPIGQGTEIKTKKHRRPGAGRPRKVQTPPQGQQSLFGDEEI